MLRGVSEEDIPLGTRGKLMGSDGRGVWVTSAPVDPEVTVGGNGAKEGKVG
jgi:hypothetical protein